MVVAVPSVPTTASSGMEMVATVRDVRSRVCLSCSCSASDAPTFPPAKKANVSFHSSFRGCCCGGCWWAACSSWVNMVWSPSVSLQLGVGVFSS